MMEQSDVEQVPQVESRWHKLLTFPLVAMLVAIATFVLAAGITSFVMRVLPMERGDARSLLGASLAVGLVLLATSWSSATSARSRATSLPRITRAATSVLGWSADSCSSR